MQWLSGMQWQAACKQLTPPQHACMPSPLAACPTAAGINFVLASYSGATCSSLNWYVRNLNATEQQSRVNLYQAQRAIRDQNL